MTSVSIIGSGTVGTPVGRGKRSIEDQFTVDDEFIEYLRRHMNQNVAGEVQRFYSKVLSSSMVFVGNAWYDNFDTFQGHPPWSTTWRGGQEFKGIVGARRADAGSLAEAIIEMTKNIRTNGVGILDKDVTSIPSRYSAAPVTRQMLSVCEQVSDRV